MTIDEFTENLKRLGCEPTRDGSKITVEGNLHLVSLTSLPKGVSLSAGGAVHAPTGSQRGAADASRRTTD